MTQPSFLRIHIADDDADDRLFLEEAIREQSASVRVSTSVSGDDLLHHLRQYAATSSLPDLLVLDLEMPGKSGLQCLDEIKSDESLCHIPVIVMSSTLDGNVATTCYRKHAAQCVIKPGSMAEMRDVARQMLGFWNLSVLPRA